MNFKQWLFNLPKTQNGLIGNEAKNTYHDTTIKPDFNSSSINIPVIHKNPEKGLGDLGMQLVGKATFKAGEIPTIIKGLPIESWKNV